MPKTGTKRLVWCGGGATFMDEETITFGSRFVRWFAATAMPLRMVDKERQYAMLDQHRNIEWVGVRPLQMRHGPRREIYRLGFDSYNGFSKITFADCAHAMLGALTDDTWLGRAPIVQY
jgi:putative NADH-flavin reductase